MSLARTGIAALLPLMMAGCAAPPPPVAGAPAPPKTVETPVAKSPEAPRRAQSPVARPPEPPKVAQAPGAQPAAPSKKPASAKPLAVTKPAPGAKPAPVAEARPSPPPTARASPPPLDLKSLERRLKESEAIGVMTKLSLKNQVDDLIERFRAFHAGSRPPTLAELRPAFELLLMKVLSLLQDRDTALAKDINASRDAIWDVLADRQKLAGYL